MPTALEQKVIKIQEKLNTFIKQHHVLAKENASLRQQLSAAEQAAIASKKEAEKAKEQLDITKYHQTEMLPEEKREFEKKINTYIKEIDKCISLLSS